MYVIWKLDADGNDNDRIIVNIYWVVLACDALYYRGFICITSFNPNNYPYLVYIMIITNFLKIGEATEA